MIAVFKRELKTYFTSMTGYVFIAFLVFMTGLYTMLVFFESAYGNFEYVVSNMSFFYLLAVPILTMRVLAEERKQKTDQLLYALPLRMSQIIVGKFLAMAAVLGVAVCIMGSIPPLMAKYGTVSLTVAYGNLIGYYLLGLSLIAIGMFLSSLTENQIVAAVLCFFTMLVLYLMTNLCAYLPSTAFANWIAFAALGVVVGLIMLVFTKSKLVATAGVLFLEIVDYMIYQLKPTWLEGGLYNLLSQCSLFSRLNNFINGVFDWTTVFYYCSITVLFLIFTVVFMEKGRWSE